MRGEAGARNGAAPGAVGALSAFGQYREKTVLPSSCLFIPVDLQNSGLVEDRPPASALRQGEESEMQGEESEMPVYTVSTPIDESDGDFSAGDLSLREAIELANASPGTDSVVFDPALAGTVLRLTQGQIGISDSVVIDGRLDDDALPDIVISADALGNDIVSQAGFPLTDVDASLASPEAATDGIDNDGDGQADGADVEGDEDLLDDNSRIFEGLTPGANITLRGLVLTGGRTQQAGENGGAVYGRGEVSVEQSLVAGNATAGSNAQGGGLYGAFLSVAGTSVLDNRTSGDGAFGGGIGGGGVIVTDSLISGNRTDGEEAKGGGASGLGLLVIRDSTVSDNATTGSGSDGGGIAGSLFASVITGSSVIENATQGTEARGGGIYSPTVVNLSNSLVQENLTEGQGSSGGGIHANALNAVSSTIDINATTGTAARGGGVFAEYAVLTNVTVSGNAVSGYAVAGGGLRIENRLEATHATITGNSAALDVSLAFNTLESGPTAAANDGYGAPGAGVSFGYAAAAGIFTHSIVLGNASVSSTFYGTPMAGPHEIEAEGPGTDLLTFRGQNIVGESMMAFDASAGNPMIRSGADRVENADPDAVFADRTAVFADRDGDGVPEFDTGWTGGAARDNGGQGLSVALAGGPNPALDRAGEDQPVSIDETFYQADLDANGRDNDVFTMRDALRFDTRGPFFAREIDFDRQANTPDIGAFELQRPPDFAIAAVDADRPEGNVGPTPFTFEITRSVKIDGPVTIDYAVSGSGADPAEDGDFLREAFPTGTVVFDDLQETATLTIEGGSDTVGEADEGFTVTLSNARGDPLGGTVSVPSAAGVIRNDDQPAPPAAVAIAALTPERIEGTAGTTVVPFLVSRTGDDTGAVTLDYAVTGSGADPVEADDFAPVEVFPSGTVTLAPGDSQVILGIEIGGDAVEEGDEGLTVTLSNPVGNATIATASADARILDDDAAAPQGTNRPPLALDDFAVTDLDTPVTVDVLLNDDDPDADPLDLAAVADPANGTAAIVAGQVAYTPDAGFSGLDVFTYEVADGRGGTDIASVLLRVGDPGQAQGSADLQRGSASPDLIAPAGAGTYLGLASADTYLLSRAIRDDQLVFIEDSGPSRIELAEGLAIESALIRADALSLRLANGAEVRIFDAADDEFAISANATAGIDVPALDYDGFVSQLFGVAVPSSGSVPGEAVLIGPPAPPQPGLEEAEAGFLAG